MIKNSTVLGSIRAFHLPADPAESDCWSSWTASANELDTCIVTRYNLSVIKSFRHKGVRSFFRRGQDMNVPGWKLHPVKGNLNGRWSVWVGGNWRLTFAFDGDDAVLVDYQDYH
jgi:hypothetical protein